MVEHSIEELKKKVQGLLLDGVEETTKVIGSGAYGIVIEVIFDGRRCAGKKIRDILVDAAINEKADYYFKKFGDEIVLHSQQDHPNIVKLLGVHFPSGSQLPMLVMEYLPFSLTQVLESTDNVTMINRYSVLLDVANGLNYLHSKQPPIIHRDLTANNILLTEDYKAKISDLGVSAVHKEHTRLKQTTAPGNNCVMPPEARDHNPVYSEKLDVFSFGCLILHTFTGQFPEPTTEFVAKPEKSHYYIKVSEWDRRAESVKMVPKDNKLLDLARHCLANTPSLRPNMSEVIEEVQKAKQCLSNNQSNVHMMKEEKVPNPTVLEQNLRRRRSRFLFKDTYEQEYVCIQKEGESMYLHFKTEKNGKLKLTYDMKTCIGVYHRKSLDHAKNKWPCDVDSKFCFIVADQDDGKTLHLIANAQGIAKEWVKELQRYVNINKVDKRKGEFSVDNLQELYDTLTEGGLLSWEIFGASLGLVDDTLKRIESCYTTDEDRLKECLLHWLKWSDGVDDKEGPTCKNLKEALTLIGKEEIVTRIDEKFSPTKDYDSTAKDIKDEGKKETWTKHGREREYRQVVANIERKGTSGAMFDLVTRKMEQNDVASVLAEICFLSNRKRSSLVTIDNKTSTTIKYHKCFIARGREARYVGFDSCVPPKSKTSYSFEKHTNLSLEGCAGMLFFSATTCKAESPECFFIVAFRNYTIKLRKPNKTVLMILKSLNSTDLFFDLLHYVKIIDNENENPINLPGCYVGDKYPTTFMWTGRGEERTLVFPSIEFQMSMDNDNYRSESVVTVLHPKTDTN